MTIQTLKDHIEAEYGAVSAAIAKYPKLSVFAGIAFGAAAMWLRLKVF